MKKIFFLIILFIFQFNSSAQEFNAGILSGLSTTQVSGDNLAGYNKAGLIIGGFVNRDISQSLALQIEMKDQIVNCTCGCSHRTSLIEMINHENFECS